MDAVYNGLLYLTGWPLACLLFFGGLYFTIRTKFPQFRLFGESIRVVSEKPTTAGSISSFGALMISTASRVGTGNIVGVSTAICIGGPGAVFWMWVTAIFGGASAFVESTLAQVYKKKDPDGGSYGGPAYYIEAALHSRFLAVIFCLALIFTYGVGYNMLASYNLQSAFSGFAFYDPKLTPAIIGCVIALISLYCLLGGGRRIVQITGFLVPVMGVLYVVLAVVALAKNIGNVPHMFGMIFADAFNFQAIFGGFMGSCLMMGFKRGLYSNEAGIGSAPNAAAAADVSHPAKQGLVQMLSVFIDTLLLCTATAFMSLCSGVEPTAEVAGARYIQLALSQTFGDIGPVFIAIAMLLFAFTTLLGNFYYIENCVAYLMKKKPSRMFMNAVRVFGAFLIFIGAIISFGTAWDIADICQCILAGLNIPVCMILGGVAYKALDNYVEQIKAGKNPVFFAKKDGGVTVDTDFWN
ncbi:MAG: alanine:cation symporter family protein [Pyramidobacter sp.]|jgi:AGCS family alanine or glycine:cation symporter|nr:alanine:cation symporter family protein [Pyramidobacter sp.]